MTKIEKIKKFLDKYKHLPEQRSADWLVKRRRVIGGSECSNVINLKKTNINTFVNNFLFNKVVGRTNQFIFPCVFGNIFENEIKNLTEYTFKTKIFETGSIPYEKLKSIAYSPDGIGIVDNEIILFEFKCPISREIKSQIKNEYFCQVHMGLHVLEEVIEGRAFYIEAEFKKCVFEDLLVKENFDKNFHNKFLDREFTELYIHFGMILFYENNNELCPLSQSLISPELSIDYGEASQTEMESLFFNVYKNNFKYIYLSDIVNKHIENGDTNEVLLKYKEPKEQFTLEEINYLKNLLVLECKKINKNPVGILPWKCYNFNKIDVYKNPYFITDDLKERCVYFMHITQYVAKLKENNNLSNEQVKDLLKKYTDLYFNYN